MNSQLARTRLLCRYFPVVQREIDAFLTCAETHRRSLEERLCPGDDGTPFLTHDQNIFSVYRRLKPDCLVRRLADWFELLESSRTEDPQVTVRSHDETVCFVIQRETKLELRNSVDLDRVLWLTDLADLHSLAEADHLCLVRRRVQAAEYLGNPILHHELSIGVIGARRLSGVAIP